MSILIGDTVTVRDNKSFEFLRQPSQHRLARVSMSGIALTLYIFQGQNYVVVCSPGRVFAHIEIGMSIGHGPSSFHRGQSFMHPKPVGPHYKK